MPTADQLPAFAITAVAYLVYLGIRTIRARPFLLGAIFAAVAVISDGAWAFAAGGFRGWFARSPRRLELVGGAGGLAIVAVGAGLLVSGRKE
jgi:threonine/homoserine/homoserine lactone efflux protein